MHFGNPTQGHYPKKKPKKKETTWEKVKRVLGETAGTMSGAGDDDQGKRRRDQFATYMNMIDKLQRAKVNLRGRVQLGNLEARAGRLGSAKVTKMSTILDNYHNKALRMAQAKYYQKQLG